jgi:hypothetical protein
MRREGLKVARCTLNVGRQRGGGCRHVHSHWRVCPRRGAPSDLEGLGRGARRGRTRREGMRRAARGDEASGKGQRRGAAALRPDRQRGQGGRATQGRSASAPGPAARAMALTEVGFLGSPCIPSLILGFRKPRLPLLPLWEKGVGGMRGKSARECSKPRISPRNSTSERGNGEGEVAQGRRAVAPGPAAADKD